MYSRKIRLSVSLLTGLMLYLFVSGNTIARSLPDFTELAAENNPAVVNISTTKKMTAHPPISGLQIPEDGPFGELFKHFFGEDGGAMPPEDAKSLGSGFIISSEGYVLTNHHVIKGADEILVRLSDKRSLKAELIGSDSYTDIALLKLDAENLPVVRIGSSDKLKVGEWVLAIGSPYGFDHSVTAGIVSAKGRSLPRDSYVPFIQTDVAINPGNSGGPLFNMDGKVVGINSQIYTNTGGFMGLSFAIPIEVAMDVVKQLKDKGRVTRGWLGVYIQEVTVDLAESFGLDRPEGALVSQVIEGSPAEEFGIKSGDVILRFNNEKVTDSGNLPVLVGRVRVGTDVKIEVLRDGEIKTINVVIGEMPMADETLAVLPGNGHKYDRIGIESVELSDKQKKDFDIKHGVMVGSVKSDSAAANAGIRADDIILQLNHQDVDTLNRYHQLVKKLPKDKPVPVLVMRAGGRQYLALKITD